jgi:hypothetical protein
MVLEVDIADLETPQAARRAKRPKRHLHGLDHNKNPRAMTEEVASESAPTGHCDECARFVPMAVFVSLEKIQITGLS